MNNWINRGMPIKQAFSLNNNPAVAGANYHFTNNIWSNTQASAQNFVKQDAVNTRTVNDIMAGLKGMDLVSPLFGDLSPGAFVGESSLSDKSLMTWDPVSNDRILQLHANIQGPAINFINQVKQEPGIKLRVTQGFRTFEEQDALYAKGRTIPGSVVTNAKGGQSYHNYGLAIDVVEISNGQVIWNTNWTGIGKIGIQSGFEWGGNFKTISDRPHFQMTFGYSISELMNLYNTGQW